MGGPGSGRPRKPTAIKVLEGKPGHRPLPKNEPKPPSDEPEMPDWLSEAAQAKWRELIPSLRYMNILSRVDGQALAGFCQAWSEFRRCTILLEREGLTYEARQGIIARPEVAIRNQAVQQIRHFAIEFGLTPAARARMGTAQTKQESDELDDMLNQPLRKAQ